MLSNRIHSVFVWVVVLASVVLAAAGCGQAQTESPPVVPLFYGADEPGGVDNPEVIADQYIFVFSKTTPEDVVEQIQQQTQELGGSILHTYRFAMNGFAAHVPPEALKTLQQDGRIQYIVTDRRTHATGVQTCPPSWGLDRIDQRSASDLNGVYTYNATGAGVDVYVLDTGIYNDHDEFGGRVSTCGFCAITPPAPAKADPDCNMDGTDVCAQKPEKWKDPQGHGTHIAGIVGGKTVGVAKAVSLYAVRVLDCDGDCNSDAIGIGAANDALAGVDWVIARHKAKVMNGKPFPPTVAVMGFTMLGGDYTILPGAIQTAIDKGIVFVVSAGNKGSDAFRAVPGGCYLPDPMKSDMCEPNTNKAITVGALDTIDHRWVNSNYGSFVDIFAPGEDIVSAAPPAGSNDTNRLAHMSGTSQAAAYVAGVAALLRQMNPDSDADSITKKLISSAADLAAPNMDMDSPRLALYSRTGTAKSPEKTAENDEDGCQDRAPTCTGTTCTFCSDPALNPAPGSQTCCSDLKCGNGIFCNDGECKVCGAEGTPCCDGNSPCAPSLKCDSSNMCSCGEAGQPCCGGDNGVCNGPLACNDSGNCGACGQEGDICCAGSCNGQDLDCIHNECQRCGIKDSYPCCDGTCKTDGLFCDFGAATNSHGDDGTCKSCGGLNKPCCPGLACDAGLTCFKPSANEDHRCGSRQCTVRCIDHSSVNSWYEPGPEACENWSVAQCVDHDGRLLVRYGGESLWCKAPGCWTRCDGMGWKSASVVEKDLCDDVFRQRCGDEYTEPTHVFWCQIDY